MRIGISLSGSLQTPAHNERRVSDGGGWFRCGILRIHGMHEKMWFHDDGDEERRPKHTSGEGAAARGIFLASTPS